MTEVQEAEATSAGTNWKDFLIVHPPDCKEVKIRDLGVGSDFQGRSLSMPELELYCPSEQCSDTMTFDNQNRSKYDDHLGSNWALYVLYYRCRHCNEYQKTFAVMVKLDEGIDASRTRRIFFEHGSAIKFGEYPSFGDPVPSRVLDLMGADRELFLSGRRSEKQGMGLGAFSYYRRVVENQWKNLIDVIINVAKAQKADAEIIALLERAKGEHQFEKAVEMTKDVMPKALLIDGCHNPLQLLHSALSKDIHNSSDEECLALAGDIREMLSRYVAMRDEVLKDRSTLDQTLNRLLQKRQKGDLVSSEEGGSLSDKE